MIADETHEYKWYWYCCESEKIARCINCTGAISSNWYDALRRDMKKLDFFLSVSIKKAVAGLLLYGNGVQK